MAAVPAFQPDPSREIKPAGALKRPVGLYLHIPFCDARCHYCDFVTYADKADQIEPYLDALIHEMSLYRGTPVETLFIGGGTPTVLSPRQIDRLLAAVHSSFDLSPLSEATVEANPESTTPERLSAYRKGGINRISFGLQATQNPLLERLGRLHSRDRFYEAHQTARTVGFENISVDLMFGLPDQSMSDWTATLDQVIALAPEHISTYALKVEPGTKFDRDGVLADDDLQSEMYAEVAKRLPSQGYEHYEISNFSRPGRASAHNLRYWLNQDTLGCGVGAASYQDGRRRKNVSRIGPYIEASLNQRAPECEETTLTAEERELEDLMLGLRLKEGVSVSRLEEAGIPTARLFLDRGLAIVRNERYSLTPEGWLLSNRLFQDFIATSDSKPS